MSLSKALGALLLFSCAACSADDAAGTPSGRSVKARDGGTDVREVAEGNDDRGDDEPRGDDVPRDDACASIRRDAAPGRAPIDVVWLVDTSASMFDDIAQITQNIASFMKDFESSTADTRAVMITLADPAAGTALAADAARYRFVPSIVESGMLYTVALSRFDSYKDFLRPGAATHFVMVTDDEDRIGGEMFRAQMEQQLGHAFVLHAIASPNENGRPCANPSCGGAWLPLACGAVAVGDNYNTLADATAGEKISICTDDWGEIFTRLSSAVIASALPCAYPLADATSAAFDPERVQVVYTPEGKGDREFPKASSRSSCGTKPGWYYDDDSGPTSVELCPAACELVQQGGSIDIALGCPPTTVI
jgi:hypothetical protein